MNAAELLLAAAAASPRAPAIIDGPSGRERITTFGELDRRARDLSALFAREGLAPGQAVLVLIPMSADLYAVMAGLLQAGLVAVFLDPGAGRKHVDRCLEMFPVQALVVTPKAWLLRLFWSSLRRIPKVFVTGSGLPGAVSLAHAVAPPLHHGPVPCGDETPALLTFTSGSTGRPKGAIRSHGLLLATHHALASHLPGTPGSVDLATLPVFVFTNLANGVTSLIPDTDLRRPGAIDGVAVARQIERLRLTTTLASPALLERVADACLDLDIRLDSLRRVATGGAPVFPRLLDKLARIAPGADIVSVYGSTEAEPIAVLRREDICDQDRSAMRSGGGLLAGRPIPELALRILRDRWGTPRPPCDPTQLEAETQPVGEAGEIVVSGAHVLPGYLGGVGDAENHLIVGDQIWHRTGDAGMLDENRRLWLLGRCAAKVADDHGVTYPLTVEAAALALEGIARCAFVARGGRRLLVVEAPPHVAPPTADLIERTLPWAHIDDVITMARVPVDRRHNAKIDYPRLRAALARTTSREQIRGRRAS